MALLPGVEAAARSRAAGSAGGNGARPALRLCFPHAVKAFLQANRAQVRQEAGAARSRRSERGWVGTGAAPGGPAPDGPGPGCEGRMGAVRARSRRRQGIGWFAQRSQARFWNWLTVLPW